MVIMNDTSRPLLLSELNYWHTGSTRRKPPRYSSTGDTGDTGDKGSRRDAISLFDVSRPYYVQYLGVHVLTM